MAVEVFSFSPIPPRSCGHLRPAEEHPSNSFHPKDGVAELHSRSVYHHCEARVSDHYSIAPSLRGAPASIETPPEDIRGTSPLESRRHYESEAGTAHPRTWLGLGDLTASLSSPPL